MTSEAGVSLISSVFTGVSPRSLHLISNYTLMKECSRIFDRLLRSIFYCLCSASCSFYLSECKGNIFFVITVNSSQFLYSPSCPLLISLLHSCILMLLLSMKSIFLSLCDILISFFLSCHIQVSLLYCLYITYSPTSLSSFPLLY